MQRGNEVMEDLRAELKALNAAYTIQQFLSSGSYGAVCAAVDDISHQQVAVKRVCSTTSEGKVVNILSDSFLCKRVLRECRLLCHFHHPNILGLKDLMLVMKNPNRHKLYIVTELMRTDLAQVIADKRIDITVEHIRFFMYNVLLGLHALHNAGVIHRDLHPGNILLSEDNDVKICDFNLARGDTKDDAKTHYVTHRWYRAPELVMQFKGFTKLVDIWSAGCIMAELYNRKALFRGTTFYNQLNRIVEVLGTPKEDVTMFSSQSAREYLSATLGNCPAQPWESIVPSAEPDAIDLLSHLLVFNPEKRLTAEQALHHPFFADLFDEADLVEDLSPPFQFDEKISEVADMHRLLREDSDRFFARRQELIAQMAMQQAQQQAQAQAQAQVVITAPADDMERPADVEGGGAGGTSASPLGGAKSSGLVAGTSHMPRSGSFLEMDM